jgi:hypothetical protein
MWGPFPPQQKIFFFATSALTSGSHRSDFLSIRDQFEFNANCKKSSVYLRDFAIKMKTCGFPKFERKCHGFMLTTQRNPFILISISLNTLRYTCFNG